MSVLFDLNTAEGFTEADRTIAQFILAHMDEMADLSINELAQRTYTSNASIIRLCRKLGTKGYREFKLSLLREAERIPSKELSIDVNYPFYDRSSPAAVMKNIADLHRYATGACYTAINALDLQRAATMIRASRNVLIYGAGESDLLAQTFARRIMRIGYMPFAVNLLGESVAVSRNATADDLAILITYSGRVYDAFAADHKILREHGCPTLLISANSQLEGFTHRILYPYAEDSDNNAATFYSTEACLYVLDALYGMLFAMDYSRVKDEKSLADSAMRRVINEQKVQN